MNVSSSNPQPLKGILPNALVRLSSLPHPQSLTPLTSLLNRKPYTCRRPWLSCPLLLHHILPPPIPGQQPILHCWGLRNLLLLWRHRHDHRRNRRIHPRELIPYGRIHNLRLPLSESRLGLLSNRIESNF
jgi:hypothetical protein